GAGVHPREPGFADRHGSPKDRAFRTQPSQRVRGAGVAFAARAVRWVHLGIVAPADRSVGLAAAPPRPRRGPSRCRYPAQWRSTRTPMSFGPGARYRRALPTFSVSASPSSTRRSAALFTAEVG